MWPPADIPRIRAALTEARAQGLLTHIAGGPAAPAKRKKHATIFDAETQSASEKTGVTSPEPILLRRPPPPEISHEISSPSELILELTVDSAGKVRSAEPAGNTKSMDPALLQAPTGWKFIPALKAGRPVASRTRMAVSLKQ
jgi:hypothetical protein